MILKGCGVEDEGVNIMNYVAPSGIYSIQDVAYGLGVVIVIPPGLSILDSN